MSMAIMEFIVKNDPCEEGAAWLRTQPSLAAAWNACVRPDWMIWTILTLPLPSPDWGDLLKDFIEHAVVVYDKRFPGESWMRTRAEDVLLYVRVATNREAATQVVHTAFNLAYATHDAAVTSAEFAWQCDRIREVVGNPFLKSEELPDKKVD